MSILLAQLAEQYGERTAIIAPEGTFTHRQLLKASGKVAFFLLDGSTDLQEKPWLFGPSGVPLRGPAPALFVRTQDAALSYCRTK